jgi:hypothetical protein
MSIGVKCARCGKKLDAVLGLTYRNYDVVVEVDPHTCEPANTRVQVDAAMCLRCGEYPAVIGDLCPECASLETPRH